MIFGNLLAADVIVADQCSRMALQKAAVKTTAELYTAAPALSLDNDHI